MIAAVWLGLVLLGACGRTIDCSDPATVLVESDASSLTCHEAGWALAYAEVVAARPMGRSDRNLALRAVVEAYEADPESTGAWLGRARLEGAALAAGMGAEGAEERAKAVYQAFLGKGPLPSTASDLVSVQRRILSVWASAEANELALTEADFEAWIRYASLCREVQSAGPLRVSVSDRVAVYRMVGERFERGSREEQIAMSRLGTIWPAVTEAWALASYEKQQAFIGRAPLPPPMTATSLGYAEAVFEGDVARHVEALTAALGPFTVSRRGPMFSKEVPAP